MELSQQILFFFSALGVFNGVILTLYFLIFKRGRIFSDYYLGALIAALTIRIGKSVFHHFMDDLPRWILQIGLTGCLFIGPFVLFYMRSVLHRKNSLSQSEYIQFGLLGALALVGVIFPYERYAYLWNHGGVHLIYLIWAGYILYAVYDTRQIWHRNSKNAQRHPYSWLVALLIANIVICAVFHSVLYLGWPSYIYGPVSFSFLFYVLAGLMLFSPLRAHLVAQDRLGYQNTIERPTKVKKQMDLEIKEQLSRALQSTMQEKKPYLDPQLKLDGLANQLNTTPHLLSQYLNDHVGKNFNSYINELRVDEAVSMMQSHDEYSLEGIAAEVGFRSKSTFYAAFKARYQMTPKAYLNTLQKA